MFGDVDEATTEGARGHIDTRAMRYMGEDDSPNSIETERIILRIAPERVSTGP